MGKGHRSLLPVILLTMRCSDRLLCAAALRLRFPPLPNSHESPEALARAVLTAIEKRDADALLALALNKEEFDRARLAGAAGRAPRAQSVACISSGAICNQKSNIMLRDTLAAHGGKKYDLVSIRFLGETTQYDSYLVHRESELTVKDADGTERQDARVRIGDRKRRALQSLQLRHRRLAGQG